MHKVLHSIGSLFRNIRLADYIVEELCRQCGRPVQAEESLDSAPGICLCAACNQVFTADKPTEWWLALDGIAEGVGSKNADPFGLPVFTASTYAGPIQKLIRRIKYDDDTLVAKDIGPRLYLAYKHMTDRHAQQFEKDIFTIVPIPLHQKRQLNRGYNQARLIAGEFARLADLPVETKMLRRVKETKPQYGLKKGERLDNVKDAFALGKVSARGRNIILIDDVFTSGATLLTCASLLRAAGALRVVAIAAARAPFDKDTNARRQHASNISVPSINGKS
ncbi:MAG: ComF family protein [Candidatus Obscuribacterales bacterium]|nr:ComF family protein [Candidatus Obscuribacterales bacterium]